MINGFHFGSTSIDIVICKTESDCDKRRSLERTYNYMVTLPYKMYHKFCLIKILYFKVGSIILTIR